MNGYLKNYLRVIQAFSILTVLASALPVSAWTSAHLFNVAITVDMASEGPSIVTTDVRFVVEGGYFHGFDFVELPDAVLDKNATVAFTDDQRKFNVEFKQGRNGRIRALLEDNKHVRKGGITFRIVHQIDFVAKKVLRIQGGRAKFDWTPLIWDVGLDNMEIRIRLPESRFSAAINVDKSVSEDYVSTVSDDYVSLIKFRPVKWYPMRVVLDFNSQIISSTLSENYTDETISVAPVQPSSIVSPPTFSDKKPQLPIKGMLLFVFVSMIAFLTSFAKARYIINALKTLGLKAEFALLKRTSFASRSILAFLAVLLGITTQASGFLAAGILPVAVASLLFMTKKTVVENKPRQGGSWRQMNEQDVTWYFNLYNAYNRSRRSLLDIKSLPGALAFVAFVALISAACFSETLRNTETALACIANSMITALPAWFGYVRSELPIDGTLEGFALLKKWQKSLTKLIDCKDAPNEAVFFVREDKDGPIEVRLRTKLHIGGIIGIEAGTESFLAGSSYRIRTVFVLRTEPGSTVSRKLAACPNVTEHHLSPDLKEEIIVLRNRRGRNATGIAPLRTALQQAGTLEHC